jgi:hypothetical protein
MRIRQHGLKNNKVSVFRVRRAAVALEHDTILAAIAPTFGGRRSEVETVAERDCGVSGGSAHAKRTHNDLLPFIPGASIGEGIQQPCVAIRATKCSALVITRRAAANCFWSDRRTR